ncbi:MAG: hypothetical protein OEW70_03710 [candidate division WOR-3 bacterium]|nr:hypothetical protein [candidate division WOR-3 bacterium]
MGFIRIKTFYNDTIEVTLSAWLEDTVEFDTWTVIQDGIRKENKIQVTNQKNNLT